MNQKLDPNEKADDESKTRIDSRVNIDNMSGGSATGTSIGHVSGDLYVYTDSLGELQEAQLRRKPILAGYPQHVPDPQPGQWVRCGGPYGGLIRALVADPTDPKVVFAGIDLPGWDQGLYRSLDNGLTWARSDQGISKPSVISLAVSYHDRLIYAGTRNGVYLSRDGGGEWKIADTRHVEFEVRCIALTAADPYQRFFGTGKHTSGTTMSVGTLTGVKSDHGGLDLTPSKDPHTGGAHFSRDGGLTWETIPIRNVNAAVFAPSDSGVIYLGTSESGLFRRDYGRWQQFKIPGTRSIYELGVSPDDPYHLLAGCDKGIFQSYDGGESWEAVSGTPQVQFSAIQFDPADGNIIYLAGIPGVFSSRDHGKSWQLLNRGLVHQRVMKLAINPDGDMYAGTDGGGVYFKAKRSSAWTSRSQGLSMQQQGLSLAAVNDRILYAGTNTAIYRSENGGKSWREVGHLDARPVTSLAIPRLPARDGVVESQGLISTSDAGSSWQIVGSAPSVFVMVAANQGGDIYRSNDGGYSWELVHEADPNYFQEPIWRLEYSPLDFNLVLAAAGRAGLLRSLDAGLTWEMLGGELMNKYIPIVAMSPHDPQQAILLMVGAGLYASIDRGNTWQLAGNDFADIPILSLAYCPHDPGRIYAGSEHGDLFIFDEGVELTLKQKKHITDGKILVIAISPGDRDSLLAGTSNGVFLSRDRGMTWETFNLGLPEERPEVNALLFSPQDPNLIFAGLFIGIYTGRMT